ARHCYRRGRHSTNCCRGGSSRHDLGKAGRALRRSRVSVGRTEPGVYGLGKELKSCGVPEPTGLPTDSLTKHTSDVPCPQRGPRGIPNTGNEKSTIKPPQREEVCFDWFVGSHITSLPATPIMWPLIPMLFCLGAS